MSLEENSRPRTGGRSERTLSSRLKADRNARPNKGHSLQSDDFRPFDLIGCAAIVHLLALVCRSSSPLSTFSGSLCSAHAKSPHFDHRFSNGLIPTCRRLRAYRGRQASKSLDAAASLPCSRHNVPERAPKRRRTGSRQARLRQYPC